MTAASYVPRNLGGELQLAIEGAKRWWRETGKREVEEMFGNEFADQPEVEMLAIMSFLCGRLDLKKLAEPRFQLGLADGHKKGHIILPGSGVSVEDLMR